MNGISVKHVIIGGLLTGLIINIGETILNASLLMPHYMDRMMAYGVAESPHSVAIFTAYGFLLGIVTIFLYAAARPRFGGGAATAVIVGLCVWVLYSGSFANFHIAIPMLPAQVPWWTLAWGLVEVPLATMAGAWIYREGASS